MGRRTDVVAHKRRQDLRLYGTLSSEEHEYDRSLPFVYSSMMGMLQRGKPSDQDDETMVGLTMPIVNWESVYNYQLVKRYEEGRIDVNEQKRIEKEILKRAGCDSSSEEKKSSEQDEIIKIQNQKEDEERLKLEAEKLLEQQKREEEERIRFEEEKKRQEEEEY